MDSPNDVVWVSSRTTSYHLDKTCFETVPKMPTLRSYAEAAGLIACIQCWKRHAAH